MKSENLMDALDTELAQSMLSRRAAILRGAAASSAVIAGLSMASVPVGLAALATDAHAQGGLPSGIVDILNFALTLEFLEAEFYTKGVESPSLLSGGAREVADQIRIHEVAHVAFLQSALGSKAVTKPTFDFSGGKGRNNGPFGDAFTNPQTFWTLAQAFEDTGVRAYKGQAPNLMGNNDVLQAALQIHSVEARHAAQVRRMRQQKGWITGDSRGDMPPATQAIYEGDDNRFQFILAQSDNANSWTEAFDEPLTKAQVLAIVAPFLA